MLLAIKSFSGIAPRLNAKRLPDTNAQVALNCDLRSAVLAALNGTSPVTGLSKPGTIRTIYRFGQNGNDESLYWFHWTDDVDVVKGQIATDVEERTYFAGDSTFGHPRVTKASIAIAGGGGTNYPLASYRLGVPPPASAPTLVSVTGTGAGTAETRQYVYTYVTGDGEEGQPSLPLEVSPVLDGQTVSLSGLVTGPAGYNIVSKRIYRVVTSVSGSFDFAFVAQITDATTTYADSKTALQLGEAIPSLDWEMPPATLRGLVNMPNGIMAGFDGNDVMFSEAYRPFAWPSKYRKPVDYPVVGLGTVAEYVVACTKGVPYLMWGSSPDSIVDKRLPLAEACVAKRSIVSLQSGVIYASPNGLVLVSPSGASLVTEAIIDKKYWTSLNPSSIEAYQYDGRYIGFYNNGTPGAFQFDPEDANQPFSLVTGITALAGFNDLVRDALYLNVGGAIRKWDAATPLTYTWRSKVFETPHAVNFGFAMVEADAYPVQFSVYSSDEDPASGTYRQRILRRTVSVPNDKAFRLPSGFLSSQWEVELQGTNTVTAVYLAQSSDELAAS